MFIEFLFGVEEEVMVNANMPFRELCIMIHSYNESQRDALFLRII
jgi:hypothetical protein